MLSAVIDVHRNILSGQCYIKVKKMLVTCMEVSYTENMLLICLYNGDDLQQEVKIMMPPNFFIPTSLSRAEISSAVIEIERESFKISQRSHYSKYRKVIERHLETLQSGTSESVNNCYKRLKIDHLDYKKCLINEENILDESEIGEINYSDHCLPVEDSIEISFRLQISSSEVIPESSNDRHSTLYEFLKVEIQPNESYEVVCTNCGSLLSTCPLYFQDIKYYCASSSDLSESWFCHKRPTSRPDMSNKTLYIGDGSIYFHSAIVESFTVVAQGAEFKCKMCNTILTSGTVSQNDGTYLKSFFADVLLLKKTNSDIDECDKLRFRMTMLSLWSMMNQKMLPICRLFLQSKVDGKEDECLLIWIPTAKVAQFKFRSTADDMPAVPVNFSTQDVYKVQYHAGTLSSPLVNCWSKDFGVDFYKVSDAFMKSVKELLISSSEYIPGGGRIVTDGFSNGCIPSAL